MNPEGNLGSLACQSKRTSAKPQMLRYIWFAMKRIAIRAVEERDISAIAAIRARHWETPAFWEDRIGRYLKGEHSPREALGDRAVFVALDGETIVGFVAGHRTLRHACSGELQWIDVVEERQRQGIASLLLAAMAAWFVEQNAMRVCVNVDPANAVARKLYQKHGARDFHEYWMVWENVYEMGKRS
jgi:GNAT superfamily N-acetyltransferase